MPGVVVSTQTAIGPTGTVNSSSGQFFLVGLTERGSTTQPILVRGMADVNALLGARVSYGAVYDQLKTFFDEGGQRAYVGRIVGGSATKGTLSLNDRAGSPVATLRVDAENAGAWSSQLKVQVQNGSVSNTFRITITLNDVVVEDKNNLANPAAAVTAFSQSLYVRLTDLGSATAAPNNNPAVLAATALSAGSDDRGTIVDAGYVAGLALFNEELGDGAVAIPGRTTSAIWTGINNHCEANNRIGLLSSGLGDDKSDLLGRVADLDSEYCGLFAPWIKVPDGSGGTRTISPEGYVAACRARAHSQVGPWRVPAGAIAQANTVVDTDIHFNTDDGNDLNDGRVSVIRVIANTVRLYGWRSMSSDTDNYELLHNRDLLNNLAVEGAKVLEQFVFETIDRNGHLLSAINAALVGMVDPIAKKNGLYPRFDANNLMIDPGYKVDTGTAVNSEITLAHNEVRARLSVRISPAGSLISLTIVKVGTLSGM